MGKGSTGEKKTGNTRRRRARGRRRGPIRPYQRMAVTIQRVSHLRHRSRFIVVLYTCGRMVCDCLARLLNDAVSIDEEINAREERSENPRQVRLSKGDAFDACVADFPSDRSDKVRL